MDTDTVNTDTVVLAATTALDALMSAHIALRNVSAEDICLGKPIFRALATAINDQVSALTNPTSFDKQVALMERKYKLNS